MLWRRKDLDQWFEDLDQETAPTFDHTGAASTGDREPSSSGVRDGDFVVMPPVVPRGRGNDPDLPLTLVLFQNGETRSFILTLRKLRQLAPPEYREAQGRAQILRALDACEAELSRQMMAAFSAASKDVPVSLG